MYILVLNKGWVVKATLLPPYHRERHIFTHDTVGWSGARACHDGRRKEKNFTTLGLEPRTFRPVA